MKTSAAIRRYLERHIEPDLPEAPDNHEPWHQVLIIPVYRESPALLDRLAAGFGDEGNTLIIMVLNRPSTDPDSECNNEMRQAVEERKSPAERTIIKLGINTQLYLLDIERLLGPTSEKKGVGLARKIGCDLALSWQHSGHIQSQWIASTDADATLPADYFDRLAAITPDHAAAVFPFIHTAGENDAVDQATALYELKLHYYVLGLEFAQSPYAYHTLGSAMAVRADAYAAVRGFPKRAGGEDFYLLNKIAKTGKIARMPGECIALRSRASTRVPFGTGPAINKILETDSFESLKLFYHPNCFLGLRAVLLQIPRLETENSDKLESYLIEAGLPEELATTCCEVLDQMGLAGCIDHCRRQSRSTAQFVRQFNQWFDGFRTLKFIHGLRNNGYADKDLLALSKSQINIWPDERADNNINSLRQSIRKHWGWTY